MTNRYEFHNRKLQKIEKEIFFCSISNISAFVAAVIRSIEVKGAEFDASFFYRFGKFFLFS